MIGVVYYLILYMIIDKSIEVEQQAQVTIATIERRMGELTQHHLLTRFMVK